MVTDTWLSLLFRYGEGEEGEHASSSWSTCQHLLIRPDRTTGHVSHVHLTGTSLRSQNKELICQSQVSEKKSQHERKHEFIHRKEEAATENRTLCHNFPFLLSHMIIYFFLLNQSERPGSHSSSVTGGILLTESSACTGLLVCSAL